LLALSTLQHFGLHGTILSGFVFFFEFLRVVWDSIFVPTLVSSLCSSRTWDPSHPSKIDRRGLRHNTTGYKMSSVKQERIRVEKALG